MSVDWLRLSRWKNRLSRDWVFSVDFQSAESQSALSRYSVDWEFSLDWETQFQPIFSRFSVAAEFSVETEFSVDSQSVFSRPSNLLKLAQISPNNYVIQIELEESYSKTRFWPNQMPCWVIRNLQKGKSRKKFNFFSIFSTFFCFIKTSCGYYCPRRTIIVQIVRLEMLYR